MDAMMTSSNDVWVSCRMIPLQDRSDTRTESTGTSYQGLRSGNIGSATVGSLLFDRWITHPMFGFRHVMSTCSVLRPEGKFIYITFGQPHFRKRFLMGEHTPNTRLEVKTLGETFHYFMYILRKES